MAKKDIELGIYLKGSAQVNKELKNIGKEGEKAGAELKESFLSANAASIVMTAGIAAVGLAVVKLGQVYSTAIQKSLEYSKVMIGMNAVLKKSGQSTDIAAKAIKDLVATGVVDFKDMAQVIRNLAQAGVKLDKDFGGNLKKIIHQAMLFGDANKTVGESMVVWSRGMKTRMSKLLDAIGIDENYSQTIKRMKHELVGLSGAELDAKKSQIVFNEHVRKASGLADAAAKATGGWRGVVMSFTTEMNKMYIKIGATITKSDGMIVAFKAVGEIVLGVTKKIADMTAAVVKLVDEYNDAKRLAAGEGEFADIWGPKGQDKTYKKAIKNVEFMMQQRTGRKEVQGTRLNESEMRYLKQQGVQASKVSSMGSLTSGKSSEEQALDWAKWGAYQLLEGAIIGAVAGGVGAAGLKGYKISKATSAVRSKALAASRGAVNLRIPGVSQGLDVATDLYAGIKAGVKAPFEYLGQKYTTTSAARAAAAQAAKAQAAAKTVVNKSGQSIVQMPWGDISDAVLAEQKAAGVQVMPQTLLGMLGGAATGGLAYGSQAFFNEKTERPSLRGIITENTEKKDKSLDKMDIDAEYTRLMNETRHPYADQISGSSTWLEDKTRQVGEFLGYQQISQAAEKVKKAYEDMGKDPEKTTVKPYAGKYFNEKVGTAGSMGIGYMIDQMVGIQDPLGMATSVATDNANMMQNQAQSLWNNMPGSSSDKDTLDFDSMTEGFKEIDEMMKKAMEDQLKVQEIKAEIDEQNKNLWVSAKRGFADMFSDVLLGITSVEDGFKGFFKALAKMILEQKIMTGMTTGTGFFGFLKFAEGGTVPGPIGTPQLAVVHGGETIRNPMQNSMVNGSGGGSTVNINISGSSGNVADELLYALRFNPELKAALGVA